jgi:hypothetical protein
MAKKQTRRSISVSRVTYERLKAFCEANSISMSQLVETRVNDFLGGDSATAEADSLRRVSGVRPMPSPSSLGSMSSMGTSAPRPVPSVPPASPPRPIAEARPASPVPMTSAAARFAVEPPPPIIKPKQETAAPKPAEKRPEQIFTF